MSAINIPGIIRGGQIEKYADGDRWSATVAAAGSATGGLFMDAAAGDRVVDVAASGSVVCVGLAIHDAAATETVVIASEGCWMVTAEGAIVAGSKVVAATTTPGYALVAGATPDARTLVGRVLTTAADADLVPCILTP